MAFWCCFWCWLHSPLAHICTFNTFLWFINQISTQTENCENEDRYWEQKSGSCGDIKVLSYATRKPLRFSHYTLRCSSNIPLKNTNHPVCRHSVLMWHDEWIWITGRVLPRILLAQCCSGCIFWGSVNWESEMKITQKTGKHKQNTKIKRSSIVKQRWVWLTNEMERNRKKPTTN